MYKIFILFIFISAAAKATDPYPKNPAIDVIQYTFHLQVNDSTDVIAGKAFISIKFKKPTTEFELDLINQDKSGKGMRVSSVLAERNKLAFNHSANRLKIILTNPAKSHLKRENSDSTSYNREIQWNIRRKDHSEYQAAYSS